MAHQIAEDIRVTFKAAAPNIVQGALLPTASFGIAVATGTEELGSLLDQADRALYRAKTEGRDCVRDLEQHFDAKWSIAG
jgi:PleD family two-component response regulator